jgi:hypothetical protein
MKTVKAMIEALQQFPPDAKCYAYEGEDCGLVIVDADMKRSGWITAGDWDSEDTKVIPMADDDEPRSSHE